MAAFTYAQLLGMLAALGGGLLVGIQRERHKVEHSPAEPAGVRTFTAIALVGAVATCLGSGVLLLAGAAVVAFALISYAQRVKQEPGLTTEIAMLATYLLSALAMEAAAEAAALFVVLATLLQTKRSLHHFTRSVLSDRELSDALLLAASVLIVLPMLPDRTLDPYEVLNPRRIWLFAVMVMSINAAGYIALRWLGPRRGLLLAGFLGGFISSTATIGGMAQRARATPAVTASCVAAALLSNVATIVQLALILIVAAPWTLARLALPLLLGGSIALLGTGLFFWRSTRVEGIDEPSGRPFNPFEALAFAAIVSVATFAAAVLRSWMGMSGVIVAAGVTGFADVHAATISLAQLPMEGGADSFVYGLAAAYSANSLMKSLAAGIGPRAFAAPVVGGIVAINLTILAAIWVTSAF